MLFTRDFLTNIERVMPLEQGWNYRLVIDNRWRYSLLFFHQISIRLYFLTIDCN